MPRDQQPDSQGMAWHALSIPGVLGHLEVDEGGLSSDIARERQARHGPNRPTPARRRGTLRRFLAPFHNILI